MPTMKQGTRGGPANEGGLRNIGNRKTTTVRFGPKAWLHYGGFFVETPILYAMDRITAVFFKRGLNLIWTSIVRPESSADFSLHPYGFGVDADTPIDLPTEEWKAVGEATAEELGDQYDILIHDAGSGMHLHTEFDPEDDESWQKEKAVMRKEWEKRYAKVNEEG